MNNKLNDKIDSLGQIITNIDTTVKAINERLEELIAALHNYDDGLEMFDDEPKSHYVTNEEADEDAFNDYGERKMGWFDKNNNPAKHTDDVSKEKKRNKRRYYKPKQK